MRRNNSSRALTGEPIAALRRAFYSDGSMAFLPLPPVLLPNARLSWTFWQARRRGTSRQGRDSGPNTVQKAIVTKTGKDAPGPFPKPARVGTYPSHPRACPGCLLRKSPDGIDRRPRALAETHSGSAFEGVHR